MFHTIGFSLLHRRAKARVRAVRAGLIYVYSASTIRTVLVLSALRPISSSSVSPVWRSCTDVNDPSLTLNHSNTSEISRVYLADWIRFQLCFRWGKSSIILFAWWFRAHMQANLTHHTIQYHKRSTVLPTQL